MEHIVQFAVGIDDEAIKKQIEEHAVEHIKKELKRDIADKIFRSKYYGKTYADPTTDPLSEFSAKIVKDVMASYKDEIIERAAELLADSYKRTKAWKETTEGVIKNDI